MFFFFKQKTAYDVRISDWSSDVCSSDLAEVVDLRTLVPFDREAVLTSVAKTGRLVIVDNSHKMGSVASEIAAVVAEEGFETLRKPIQRVATPTIQIPYNRTLETQLYPTKERVAAAVRRRLGRGRGQAHARKSRGG